MNLRSLNCIVFACLLLSGHAARAEWTATAQITNLSLNVLDLTPDDGQNAAFSYQAASSNSHYWLQINDTWRSQNRHSNLFTLPPDMGLSDAAHGARLELEILPGLFSSRSETSGSSGSLDALSEDIYVFLSSSLYLGLAPHSALQVSAQFSGALRRDGPEAAELGAFSSGTLTTSTSTGLVSQDQIHLRTDGNDPDLSLDRELSVVFRNDSDTISYLWVTALQSTRVGVTTPVPEPATYIMLLAGAALLLPRLRRPA